MLATHISLLCPVKIASYKRINLESQWNRKVWGAGSTGQCCWKECEPQSMVGATVIQVLRAVCKRLCR